MNKSHFLTAAFTLAGCYYAAGQQPVDTSFIKKYEQRRTITAFFARKSINLKNQGYTLQPNSPLNLGLGYSVQNTKVNFEASLIGIRLASKDKYGKTHVIDLEAHNYGRHMVIDVFFQRYRGFYHEDKNTKVIRLSPDLYVQRIGGEATYLFNSKQLSARAAFQQKEKQIKSAGSFVLGGGLYYTHLNNSRDTAAAAHLKQFSNYQLGAGAGYAYAWVINRRFQLSGIATMGANAGNNWQAIKKGDIKFYPRVFARFSMGYLQPAWGLYFSTIIHNDRFYPETNDRLDLSTVNFQLAYIRHFTSFLKRSNNKSAQ